MEKVFDHTNHRKLWEWLAENPGKGKYDWPGWVHNGGNVESNLFDCLACVYTRDGYLNCDICPVVWKRDRCENQGSEYQRWRVVKYQPALRTVLALQIANLPVKPGVITK